MKKYIVLALLGFSSISHAKDLGVMGRTFMILEQDILEFITTKLQTMQKSGVIDQKNKELKDNTVEYVHAPTPVEGLGIAQEPYSWIYDPTLTVTKNIYDGDGKAFIKKGTTVNPLTYMPLDQTLVFIDATRPNQINFATKTIKSPKKIILVNGRPIDLMKKFKVPVYFDQKGTLTKRFGIKNTPTIVKQEDLILRITEVPLND